MEIIVIVTDAAGLEASARIAAVDGDAGPRWLGHTLSADPAALVLPAGVTLAAVVDRLRELAVDRDGAAA